MIYRNKVPDRPWNAQLVGDINFVTCTRTSYDEVSQTSPLGDGYCTQVAYASDNPGYNVDATPAPPLRDVFIEVGAGC